MLLQLLFIGLVVAAPPKPKYTATYTAGPNLPNITEQGQIGTNHCGTDSSQSSLCQTIFVNSIDDWCIWGPPWSDGKNATVGETERESVGYCLKAGYGTRLIPEGTIQGAHLLKTPEYMQITGWGDFTKIGLRKGDAGGELDPHGADGFGNPRGGLVFGNSYGQMQQYHEWTNFMSATEFCIRVCNPAGSMPNRYCEHIYDIMGCEWNMPANYDAGYFDSCLGDSGPPMGIYGSSRWRQGDAQTPAPHPKPKSSECIRVGTPLPSLSLVPSTVTVSTAYSTGTAGLVYATPVVLGASSTLAPSTVWPTATATVGATNAGAIIVPPSVPLVWTMVLGVGAGILLGAARAI